MDAKRLEEINALVRDNVSNGSDLPSDWVANEADLEIINMIFHDKKPANKDDEAKTLEEFVRLDSKTHRIITSGLVIFCGEAYFDDMDNAVEYLNAKSGDCTPLNEADRLAEEQSIYEDFYTVWYEPS